MNPYVVVGPHTCICTLASLQWRHMWACKHLGQHIHVMLSVNVAVTHLRVSSPVFVCLPPPPPRRFPTLSEHELLRYLRRLENCDMLHHTPGRSWSPFLCLLCPGSPLTLTQ